MSHTKIRFKQELEEGTQQGGMRGVFQNAKERLMHMCYEFSKYRFYPTIFSGLLILCSYLQIYGQLLDKHFVPRVSEEWGPFSFVATLVDLCRITPFFGDGSDNTGSLAFVYLTFSLIVLYILAFYYMHHAMDIKRLYFILPVELASLYSAFLLWVLIGPVCEVYVMVYFCNQNETVLLFPGTPCWSTEHYIHIAFVTLGLLLHIISTFVVAFFFNESRASATVSRDDALTRLDMSAEIFFTCFRVLISLFGRWLLERELNWVLLLLHFVYAALFAYNYYRYVPYYNSLISSLYFGCIGSHLWQIINIILYNVLGGDGSLDPDRKYQGVAIVISIGMIMLFAGAARMRKQFVRHRLIDLHHAKITSDEELDLYVQSILFLFDRQLVSPADELLLRGIVARHKAECLDPDCPLLQSDEEKLYQPLTELESGDDRMNVRDKVVILSLLNSIYRERERRLGDQASACLHLIYSNFMFKEMGNIHMAIVQIMKAQRAAPSFQQEFSIYQLLRSIEDYLVKKYRKKGENKGTQKREPKEGRGVIQGAAESWDVTIVIKFENWLVQLVKIVEKCAGEHIEFWSHLESMLPDLTELNRIGLNILQSTRDITKIWKKISKINPNHPKALNIYGYYLRDIKNDPELGQEYIEKAISINLHKSLADDFNNEFELMFAEETAIIVINGCPEYLGKITKTNAGVFKVFGYNPYEIYGNDVSILMPGLFAQQHSKFMQRYFETGRQYMIQNEKILFALHRNNYLICISIVIKPVPSLTTAVPHYIGLMRQIQKEYDFIITDKHGKIDAISMGIYHTYNITANTIKESQVYIHLICPELADPVHYSRHKLRLKFDRVQGRHKLNFLIPRDFTTLVHLFSQTAKDPLELTTLVNQQAEDEDLPFKQSQSSQFFNLTYKIYQQKYKGKEFEVGRRNIVKECFDYTKFDVRTQAACDIGDMTFAGDLLHVKVFKIYRAKVIKRKNSLEDYNIGEETDVKALQRHPSQAGRKVSQFEPHTRRYDFTTPPKRSCTGVRVDSDIDPSGGNSQRQDSEKDRMLDWSPRNRGSIPDSSEAISIPIDTSMMESKEKTTEEKKQSMETSMSSEKRLLKLQHVGESASNSTPDPRGVSASGASENVSFLDEERKRTLKDSRKMGDEPPVIKIIDTRQMEVAKKLLFRKKTFMEQEKGEEKREEEKEEDPDKKGKVEEPKRKEEKKVDADTGSVATTTHNLLRIISSLQGALQEMYSPPAIGQLKLLACIVFLVFLALTISCYIVSLKVYDSLSDQMELIIACRDRSSSLANIAGSTQLLVLLKCQSLCLNETALKSDSTQGINYQFNGQIMNYSSWVSANLGNYADTLKQSQDKLSQAEMSYNSDKQYFVNPRDITLNSVPIPGTASNTTQTDCHNALNAVITHALEIKDEYDNNAAWQCREDPSVEFLVNNTYNNILSKLEGSMDAVLEETKQTSRDSELKLMIFFLVASGALILTIIIVMPVVVKIRKNKQELLCLFLEIPVRRAKTQLEKCHLFCRMIHGEAEVERQDMDDDEKTHLNLEKKFNDETDLLLEEEKNPAAGPEHGKKRRKFKPYSAEIISLILESLLVVSVLVSFFLYDYLRGNWLKNTMGHLVVEIGSIASRMTSNELYYWIGLELIATNGLGFVMNKQVDEYFDEYNSKILNNQEKFLQIHSDNSPYSDDSYKDLFYKMIYSDICPLIFNHLNTSAIATCQGYMDGVLKKGLNSANVAFWDALREVANDFRRSVPRDTTMQNAMIHDKRIVENHWLLYLYFSRSYDTLQQGLQESVVNLFDFEKLLLITIFIIYLALLLLIYIVFTQVFIENTKDSLWVTKSLLTILPAEIILQVSKIRHFVLSTSKSMIYGLRAD